MLNKIRINKNQTKLGLKMHIDFLVLYKKVINF